MKGWQVPFSNYSKPVESFFQKKRKEEESHFKTKGDVYLDALNKQLKAACVKDVLVIAPEHQDGAKQPEVSEHGDSNKSKTTIDPDVLYVNQTDSVELNDALIYIKKLEGMLEDERKTKTTLLENLKQANRKYLRALSMLTKAQNALLATKGTCVSQQMKKTSEEGEKTSIASVLPPELIAEPLLLAQKKIILETFLTEDEIKVLDSIHKTKRFDSTFIRRMMMFIYKDQDSLKLRTLSGRSRSTQKNSRFSPEKLNIIYTLFKKRIDLCGDKTDRWDLNYIHRLISSARSNILKSPMTFSVGTTANVSGQVGAHICEQQMMPAIAPIASMGTSSASNDLPLDENSLGTTKVTSVEPVAEQSPIMKPDTSKVLTQGEGLVSPITFSAVAPTAKYIRP